VNLAGYHANGFRFLAACGLAAGAILLIEDVSMHLILWIFAPSLCLLELSRSSRAVRVAFGLLFSYGVMLAFVVLHPRPLFTFLLGIMTVMLPAYALVPSIPRDGRTPWFPIAGVAGVQTATVVSVLAVRQWSERPTWVSPLGVGLLIVSGLGYLVTFLVLSRSAGVGASETSVDAPSSTGTERRAGPDGRTDVANDSRSEVAGGRGPAAR
jgi:hypothetical protein